MSSTVYPVATAYAAHTQVNVSQLAGLNAQATQDESAYWTGIGRRLHWAKAFTEVKDVSFNEADLHIRWFHDGELNVAFNCLDRHLPARAQQTAIIFEPDDPAEPAQHISYGELHARVCRLANALLAHGVKAGDRISIYLPMIPEAAVAMLACARIGAVHSVVFGGFSPEALAGRIADCQSELVITADEGRRGGKTIPLKRYVDEALTKTGTDCVHTVLVYRRTGGTVLMHEGRDRDWDEFQTGCSAQADAPAFNAEQPLFILYTSGSTGKPKGVLHTSAGYLAWAAHTHELVFDYREGEVHWCTADVGWITGHSYVVYGPLANGATTVMFEGVPQYPDWSRFWQICAKHQVNIFYTAPTAIRALMREGDAPVSACSRASIRLLGTVGEPINPEAWEWYYRVVGEQRCPIVDTWWQTETGGILLSPLPGATALKPGSACQPLPGIKVALVDANGATIEGAGSGNLLLTDSWPGQMRTVYGDHARFFDTYFRTYPGSYFTGDGARRDEDGYYWITGRVDDVLNVSGHRIGTAEVESALVAHHAVAEAAVVGYPHAIKGQGIYAYVTLRQGIEASAELVDSLRACVQKEIGAIAKPDVIQWAPALPKTRSGKIMRRILRKIAENDVNNLGDISTLADSTVVDQLVANRVLRPE